MGVRERIQKYREVGGASDMVRVEVLVPEKFRSEILAQAAEIRLLHREKNARLQRQIDWALEHYSVRIKDNLDLDRISDIAEKSRLVAKALIERGDARAFAAGRKLLDEAESPFGNTSDRSANGDFLRFGAHVPDVRSAPMLKNHHFRLALTNSETASEG